jgi:CARDB
MKSIHAVFLAAMVIGSGSLVDEAQAGVGAAAAVNQNAAKIQLTCSYGASDVARVYRVKNNTGKVILKGAKIAAESTLNGAYPNDKRPALLTLQNDLLPMQTLELVKTGQTNGGNCKAYIENPGKPDLIITSLIWTKMPRLRGTPVDGVRVIVKNRNAFAPAVASKTRVQTMSCAEAVVTTVLVDTPALSGGESKTLFRAVSRQYPAQWLKAYANATNTVPESNKSNNGKAEGQGTCIH